MTPSESNKPQQNKEPQNKNVRLYTTQKKCFVLFCFAVLCQSMTTIKQPYKNCNQNQTWIR